MIYSVFEGVIIERRARSSRSTAASPAARKPKVESTPPSTASPPPVELVKREDSDEEDVKPQIKREKRTRSGRSMAPSYAEESEEEEGQALKRRRRRSEAPDDVKLVKDEAEQAALEDGWKNQAPRPDWLNHPDFNLLDPDTFSVIPRLQEQPTPASLSQEAFHRDDLEGASQATISSATCKSRKHLGTTRRCMRSDLQIGLEFERPGKAWVSTTRVHPPGTYDNPKVLKCALFVQFAKPDSFEESWYARGLSRIIYNGTTRDGEFRQLSPVKQEGIIDAVYNYLTMKPDNPNRFVQFVFEDCVVEPCPGSSVPRNLLWHQKDFSLDERRSYIRDCLETNTKLKFGYSITVYNGDNAEEIAECQARRDKNRRGREEKMAAKQAKTEKKARAAAEKKQAGGIGGKKSKRKSGRK